MDRGGLPILVEPSEIHRAFGMREVGTDLDSREPSTQRVGGRGFWRNRQIDFVAGVSIPERAQTTRAESQRGTRNANREYADQTLSFPVPAHVWFPQQRIPHGNLRGGFSENDPKR